MKVVIIGATGTLGKAVVHELSPRHEIIEVGHSGGQFQVDITSLDSIEKMYQGIGPFDALIITAGKVHFGELTEMGSKEYTLGLQHKLMGQVNVVLAGLKHINERGSFTLTSGILNHDPIRYGSSAAMVNGAIDGFVTSAAIEMPKNIRINAVSPTVITQSMSKYADYFRGFHSVDAKIAALAYSKSVEGQQTGQIYRVGYSVS